MKNLVAKRKTKEVQREEKSPYVNFGRRKLKFES